MEHARQPGAGWRGAKVLAQMLIHRAGKVLHRQQICFLSADSVSRFPTSADLIFVSRFCQQIPSADYSGTRVQKY